MSTRRKTKKDAASPVRGAYTLSWLMSRIDGLGTAQDKMVNLMIAAMTCFEYGAATPENWAEIAGVVNVCGLAAQARGREDWWDQLNTTGDTLRAIEQRYRGQDQVYQATEAELLNLRAGVNLMNDAILPAMPLVEVLTYIERVNAMFEVTA